VSGWPTLFLAVIAAATVVMAVMQVYLIVYITRLAHRVDDLGTTIDREIKPLLANVNTISGSAVRAASIMVAQAERADRLFADLVQRVDETASMIQNVVLVPAREGRAVLAAITAAIAAFRELRTGGRSRGTGLEEEDPLFIG
jgi:hypothetical protein